MCQLPQDKLAALDSRELRIILRRAVRYYIRTGDLEVRRFAEGLALEASRRDDFRTSNASMSCYLRFREMDLWAWEQWLKAAR